MQNQPKTSVESQEIMEHPCSGTVPSSKSSVSATSSWTADESRQVIDDLFGSKRVHSLYTCSALRNELSKEEIERIKPKKFNHSSYINRNNWWLACVEGEGMYCLVCKKHMMKHPQNCREVFAATPSIRFKHDAVKTHSSSKLHSAALNSDKVQKTSCFHQEFLKKCDAQLTHIEKAFSVAYFLLKEFIANRKFQPLLNFIQAVSGDETLKYFRHESAGSHKEIFQTIGGTIKTELLKNVNKSLAYGLLTDEVSDISVSENLVTFVQFYCSETKKVETKFLSCQNILQDFESANATAIKSLLGREVEKLGHSKLTGFSSDGASVMTGKDRGVAALLRAENPSMVNIHCVCHRLALSCNDSNEALAYIKIVETLLRQLWQLFENSPKKMALYLRVQLAVKSLKLEEGKEAKVASRLKKACRTRWLSLDAAVSAVKQDFEAILQTLSMLEEKDATACGLLKKMKNFKFLGTIYILHDVLPILSELSKHFQHDSINFSAILPAINLCKDKLKLIETTEAALQKLAQDIDSLTDMCSEITLNDKMSNELQNLLKNYINGLVKNTDRRFSDTSAVVAAFNVFDPTTFPRSDEVDFKTHGDNQITVLADHFFTEDVQKEKLATQWKGFKYHVHDVLLPNMPEEVKYAKTRMTPTEWLLMQLLRSTGLRHFNPELVFVAEAAASLPVSNAWPERGASILKAVKTKHRNRLSGPMLESILHVAINGPQVEDSQQIIKQAVMTWLEEKPRRMVAAPPSDLPSQRKTVCVQTEQTGGSLIPSRDDIRAILKDILVEEELDYSSGEDSDS